jgi:SAM-dependent methyltransferase
LIDFTVVVLERILLRGEWLSPVLRLKELRDESFSRFWIKVSGIDRCFPLESPYHSIRAEQHSLTYPGARDADLQVEPTGSSALIPPLLATAGGTVLDIGPGTGTQTKLFDPRKVQMMFGAEPCVGLHEDLRAKIVACGFSSKYHILPCGAEPQSLIPALNKAGFSAADLESGIFDTIVCVRVLCSVPNPAETIRGLYDLLKPGGKLLICEHVVNPWTSRGGSVIARLFQALYGFLGWSFFVGDCHLNRDTERTLKEVGDWESVALERSFCWAPLTYISGALVKKI